LESFLQTRTISGARELSSQQNATTTTTVEQIHPELRQVLYEVNYYSRQPFMEIK